jgi:hypothetical protein
MSNTNTGGYAFPTSQIADSNGMTLQGLCAGFASPDGGWPDSRCSEHYDVAAAHAYLMADAMLKARN